MSAFTLSFLLIVIAFIAVLVGAIVINEYKNNIVICFFVVVFLCVIAVLAYMGVNIPTKEYKNNNITKISTIEECKLLQTEGKYVTYDGYSNPRVVYISKDGVEAVSSNKKSVHYYEVSSEEEMRLEKYIYKFNDYSLLGKDLTMVGFDLYLTEPILKELGQEEYYHIEVLPAETNVSNKSDKNNQN